MKIKQMMKDKRGVSLSSFTEVAIFASLFVFMIVIISADMNHIYGTGHDLTFGLGGTANTTYNEMSGYQGTLQSGLENGQAEVNSQTGFSLGTMWGMILGGIQVVGNFITGQWIGPAVGMMQMGSAGNYLAGSLRILFLFGLGYILIKLIMKVKP